MAWSVHVVHTGPPKGKLLKRVCCYRPIPLLSLPGKVFSHVVVGAHTAFSTNDPKPAKKSRFTASRSTIDAKLALRLLSELHRQFNRSLFVVFVDIESAFDLVQRNVFWKALHARGIPDILLHLLRITTLILVRWCHNKTW